MIARATARTIDNARFISYSQLATATDYRQITNNNPTSKHACNRASMTGSQLNLCGTHAFMYSVYMCLSILVRVFAPKLCCACNSGMLSRKPQTGSRTNRSVYSRILILLLEHFYCCCCCCWLYENEAPKNFSRTPLCPEI